MDGLTNQLFHLQLFMEHGGSVLWLILFASVLMWTLITERYIYLFFRHPKQVKQYIDQWQQRAERNSWYAQQIRQGMIAQSRIALQRYLMPIRSIVMALPMLGLLGTVNGMIQVFDVMTVFGSGNARGMAVGISVALVTTMAGLLTSLSGLYFSTQLNQRVLREVGNMADALRRE